MFISVCLCHYVFLSVLLLMVSLSCISVSWGDNCFCCVSNFLQIFFLFELYMILDRNDLNGQATWRHMMPLLQPTCSFVFLFPKRVYEPLVVCEVFFIDHGSFLSLVCADVGWKRDLLLPMKWRMCLLLDTRAMLEYPLKFAWEMGVLCGSMKFTWGFHSFMWVPNVVFYCSLFYVFIETIVMYVYIIL